jgi:RNA polymerase primary sigma factor
MSASIPAISSDVSLSAEDQYMREIRSISPLDNGEEQQLLTNIHAGCQEAQTRLVEVYQPWIVSVAQRYAPQCRTLSLVGGGQEGNLGLLEAIDRHDERLQDVPFRSWAHWWVRGMMRRAYWRFEAAFALPEHDARALGRLASAQHELLGELNREPHPQELAQALRLPLQRVLDLLILQCQQMVSLDQDSLAQEGVSLAERLPAMELASETPPSQSSLRSLVARLPRRERRVISLRYGLDGDVSRTQREVAAILGLSLASVEEADRKGRCRLRSALSGGALGPQVA